MEISGGTRRYGSLRVHPMTDEHLGRLLSLISHEVRAPVGVIRGYLRLMEQQGEQLTHQHRHIISAALRASDRAAEILAQVSVLARLQRGEVEAAPVPTLLEPLLQAAMNDVALPTDPAVTLQLGESPATSIAADEGLLKAALSGLLSAVVKAQATDGHVHMHACEQTRDGRPGVTITIAADDPAGAGCREAPLDILRGGLALDLPIAGFVIAAHGGYLAELRDRDRFSGIVVWLPR